VGRLVRFLLPGLVLLALYWAVFGGEYSVWELRDARADLERSRAELTTLRREIDSLRAWADSLRNDPWTLERLAREDHGLVRDGEEVIRVTGAPAGDSVSPDSVGRGGEG
jgi:cell division protein FtsB